MSRLLMLCVIWTISAELLAGTWNTSGKITQIYLRSLRQGIYIKHENMLSGDCSKNKAAYYFLDSSDKSPLFKEMFTLLAGAYESEKSVRLYLNGCQADYQYPVIEEIMME